jgi:hypothetical protein
VNLAEETRKGLAQFWLADLYEKRVRSQRTRAFSLDFPERENHPQILHTLLGIELQVGKRRVACPDLATARYLRVFARLGVREVAVPYDITKISVIADELETAWKKLILSFENSTATLASKRRARYQRVRQLRSEINTVGPGEMMPKFDRETRQRRK